MAPVIYELVVELVEQLSVDEQQALIAHLQERSNSRKINSDEWNALLNSVTVSIPPGPTFSDKREDRYENDGR